MRNMLRREWLARAFPWLGIGGAAEAKATAVGEWNARRTTGARGYLSRLLPDDYVFVPRDPMTLAEDIDRRVREQRERLERADVQLAGCRVAALGWHKGECGPDSYGWSPAFEDVLALRLKFEAALRFLSDRMPPGQVIAFYPCGCSALSNAGRSEMPRYCGEHGARGYADRCHLIEGSPLRRPGARPDSRGASV